MLLQHVRADAALASVLVVSPVMPSRGSAAAPATVHPATGASAVPARPQPLAPMRRGLDVEAPR